MLDQVVLHRGLILEVDLGLATRHFVQGRLRDIEVAVLDQLRHLTVEEREQQRADVRAVNIRIGHDDDLVVAQFIDVEFIAANSCAERHNKVTDFLTAQHPVKPGAFDVQDLTFQGQDRLCLAVTARLRRATGGVTLHQKDFGFGRVFFRAILELARKEVGYLLRRALTDKGITVKCAANSKEILGENGKVRALLLDDGTELPCDLLVMAVGIRPNVALGQGAGLAVGKGIHVDDQMVTSDVDVLAVGECVEHNGALFGLVAPLYDQAKVAAQTLLGQSSTFVPKELSTKLKVTGCDLFSAGDFADGEGREDIVFRDPARGVYRRLVIKNNVVIGAVMYGDTADSNWFFGLIRDKTDIADMRDTLIFGPAYQGGTPLDPLAAVAALPRDAEICGCNGICKGQIEDAIAAGASDLGAIKATTKASASCGTCTGLVEQVLAVTLGDDFVLPAAASICGCTDMTHEDVRRMIKSQRLTSMPAVWQECGWKTPDGCHVCRPALNFYLLADWPLEYRDDPQSRFINERKHANIQKDGTYSVVPRMWGGITTPDELRAIADAADKYMVPTVKVTGGQRIDLLGVKSEDLPDIWADLNAAGMVSGHAYSKGLRTVKTCVGTDHCRFGTQDSTGLGIQLEKELWGAWTPHKLKLGVSGCPRNCAEATCKDIGVICVDSGYQISIGGAAGMDVRETELLIQVPTEQEAINVIKAVTQLYRENAKYLDRIYKWMAKVGLDWIKERVAAEGDALVDRFELSQTIYRKDPWAEHVAQQAERYKPLATLSLEAAE